MSRLFFSATLLLGLATSYSGQAQNRAPVQPTRRNPTERISPMPGVVLPAGVSQRNAEPVPAPTQVQPNGVLPQPAIPTGDVTVGPLEDSVRTAPPARRRSTPAQRRQRRP